MTAPQNPRVTQADRDCAQEMWLLSINYGSRKEMEEVVARYREAVEAALQARRVGRAEEWRK